MSGLLVAAITMMPVWWCWMRCSRGTQAVREARTDTKQARQQQHSWRPQQLWLGSRSTSFFHTCVALKSVHLCQQLVERLLALVVAATNAWSRVC
jgi:hypothetical protein